jgi:hypothetical protein
LENSLGSAGRHRRFQDLDHLAGTWTDAELEDFNKAAAASAMEQGAILLSADAHFTWIDGLLLNIPL